MITIGLFSTSFFISTDIMKKIIPILLALLLLVGLMPISAFAADEKIFPISLVESKAVSPSGADTLFDGDNSTHWDVIWEESIITFGEVSVTVMTQPIILTQYTFITSNDAERYWGAFPSTWTLYGGNSINDCNTVIGTYKVEKSDNDDLKTNYKEIKFTAVSDCENPFSYFKFVFGGMVDEHHSTSMFYKERLKLGGICNFKGYTQCDVLGHFYQNGICTVCGHECENEFHNGVYTCPDCGMEFDPTQGNPLVSGTILSTGYSEIVYGIGGIAIGVVATLLISRKKKVAVSSTSAGNKE